MTSIPQTFPLEMDQPHIDDQMDLATSPFRPTEDVDFEDFDQMHDYSVNDDDMFDEAEFGVQNTDVMQAEQEQQYQDDEMLDEEVEGLEPDTHIVEVDAVEINERGETEDEILYDEDEQTSAAPGEAQATIQAQDPLVVDDTSVSNVDNKSRADLDANAENTTKDIYPTNNNEQSSNQTQQSTSNDELSGNSAELANANDNLTNDHGISQVEVLDFAQNDQASPPAGVAEEGGLEGAVTAADDITVDISIPPNLDLNTGDLEPDTKTFDESTEKDNTALAPRDETTGLEDQVVESSEPDPATRVDSYHSVKVTYLDEEMSLFPPKEEDSTSTFFLQDSNLAFETFDKLLAACREVLGDSLGHEDELVMDIPALGLHICEDSRYASDLSLSQITDVYLALSHNEQLDPIDPLHCFLTSRVSLATQYAYLSGAAQEGTTFSEIMAEHVDTPEAALEDTIHGQDRDDEQEADTSVNNSTSVDEHKESHAVRDAEKVASEEPQALESVSNASTNRNAPPQIRDDTTVEVLIELEDAAQVDQRNNANDTEESSDQQTLQGNHVPTSPNGGLSEHDQTRAKLQEDHIANFDEDHIATDHHVDNETTSSHTVEADHTTFSQTDPENVDEELDFDDQDDFTAEDAATEATDERHATIVEQESSQKTMQNTFLNTEPAEDLSSDAVVNSIMQNDDLDHPQSLEVVEDNDLAGDEFEVFDVDESTVNVTPSKQPNGKRKALEDEDDLDFLEFSTPEPKRTRSS